MNFIKRHFLNRELLVIEYKVNRHFALSTLKVELETRQTNIIKKAWRQFQYNHVMTEHELLSEQLPRIKSRIEEISEELKK